MSVTLAEAGRFCLAFFGTLFVYGVAVRMATNKQELAELPGGLELPELPGGPSTGNEKCAWCRECGEAPHDGQCPPPVFSNGVQDWCSYCGKRPHGRKPCVEQIYSPSYPRWSENDEDTI